MIPFPSSSDINVILGSYAKVKLGMHTRTLTKVALKMIKHIDPSQTQRRHTQRTRIEREKDILTKLSAEGHPNVVKLLDSIELEGW
jgi:serine/threonine protein kinase